MKKKVGLAIKTPNKFAEESSASTPKATTKYPRIDGGIAAVPKPVKTDYDSDDARIIELKQQGFSDEIVVKKLQEEGRIRYKPKTIGSRWLRIRKVIEKETEQRLDELFLDWYSHEDDHLLDCVAAAKEKFDHDIERVTQNMWRDVAKSVSDRLNEYKFSSNACRERFEGLKSGTALPPVNQDPDPEARRALRASRIAELQHAREAEIQKKKESKKEALQRKQEKVKVIMEKAQVRKEQQKERENAKAILKSQRDEIKAHAKADRDARESFLAKERKRQEEKKREKHLANRLYQHLTGAMLHRPHVSRASLEPEGRVYKKPPGVSRAYERDEEEVAETPNKGAYDDEDDEEDEESLHLNDDPESSDDERSSEEEVMPTRVEKLVVVDEQTLLNPRSILTDAELEVALSIRGLAPRGRRETQPQMVARLAAADEAFSMAELDQLLDGQFPDVSTKKEKIRCLQVRDARNSNAGGKGVSSTSMEFKKGYEGYKGKFRALIEKRD